LAEFAAGESDTERLKREERVLRERIGSFRAADRLRLRECTKPLMTRGLSYWDAAIVAAARVLGCRELLSEDMSHGREFEGVIIKNPFR